jgi:hypothetical protein
LRVVQSRYYKRNYKAWFLMKGTFGSDDERVSRFDIEEDKDKKLLRVVMRPATAAELKRLGLNSASDPWPPSQAFNYASNPFGIFSEKWLAVEGNPLVKCVTPRIKPIATDHMVYRYMSAQFKALMTQPMGRCTDGSPHLLAQDYTFGFGWTPKIDNRDIVTLNERSSSPFYLLPWTLPDPKKQIAIGNALTLLFPKAGESMAKGIAEYVTEGVGPNDNTYFGYVRLYTNLALPDDKIHTFIEARRITEKEAQAFLKRAQ